MCGFFISNDPLISHKNEIKIEELLRFRGPDYSSGLIKKNGWHYYHSRLSIIDISDSSSNQPLIDKDGGVLVFNGEILNYKELAKKYFSESFNSDTKLLSQLIVTNQLDLNELDGFFSFCYVDSSGVLRFVARDKFGVKPLFYYENNGYITICSEPSVIKEIFSLSINDTAIEEYDKLRAPIFSGSFFKSINSLSPGSCFVNGTYFDVKDELKGNYEPVCYEELSEAIKKGVSSRLVSDAKVGLLLSKGIDSNLIRAQSDFGKLYSIGFENDEDVKYLSSLRLNNLTVKYANENYYKTSFEYLLNLRKEPLSVPNEVLLADIGNVASKDDIKVLLSGEGADEFFAGYDRIFKWASISEKFILEEFLDLYAYGKIEKNTQLYDTFSKLFENVKLPNTFEYVRWFFIRYHMPVLFRRLDFSLMSAGIEGREPLANIHIFNVAKKMGPDQLISGNLGKIPLRVLSEKIYGKDFAYSKKIGFPVNIKNIYKDNSSRSSYDIWFKKNKEILK